MSWEIDNAALVADNTKTDQQVADAINAITQVVNIPITSTVMLKWLGVNGRYARLLRISIDQTQPDAVVAVAQVTLLMLNRADTIIDLSDPETQGMFAVITSAMLGTVPLFDSGEIANLQTLAQSTVPKYETITVGMVNTVRSRS